MSDSKTAYYDKLKDLEEEKYASEVKSRLTPDKDKYVQSVKNKFEQRSQIGIKKYNTTLEREDLQFLDWLRMAQEEAMDFTLYIERIMDEVKKRGLDKL
jgi:hypothetical protein